jgi:hypothetical protein
VDRGAAHKNFYLADLGAFLALCAKNQAFRYNNAAWRYALRRRYSASILCAFRSVAAAGRDAFFSVMTAVNRLYTILCVIRVIPPGPGSHIANTVKQKKRFRRFTGYRVRETLARRPP